MLRKFALTLLLAAAMTGTALAGNPLAGAWKASSGYTVHIPESSGDFELVWVSFTGERITHPARWVTVGKKFTWTDKQGSTHTATVDPKNPDRVMDVNASYPTSHAYWYRKK